MKPSKLSVTTVSGKRSRSSEGRSRISPILSPMQVDTEVETTVPLPSFLNLTKLQVSARFQDLEWKQRFRLAHAFQHTHSPWILDKSPVITSRNRYNNIQPWAHSRIHLKVETGQSDYVNASPIVLRDSKGEETESKYIATQGPKDTSHFWHMVFQETQEPAVVVMLTQTVEGNREKCAQYFPLSSDAPTISLPTPEVVEGDNEVAGTHDPFVDSAQQPLPSGNLRLVSKTYDPRSRSEIRQMELTIGSTSRTVYHYLFTGWADYGKPEGQERDALFELIKQTAVRSGNSVENPRIVHCSAGVGRTGTFIALDYLLKELESGAMELPANRPIAKLMKGTSPTSASSTTDSTTGSAIENILAASTEETNSNEGSSGPASVAGSAASSPHGSPRMNSSVGGRNRDENLEDSDDLIYQTVNLLREQRMMMVMNEIQYSFIYEALRERFLSKYLASNGTRIIPGEGTDIDNIEAINNAASASNAGIGIDGAMDVDNNSSSQDDGLRSGERSPKIARKSPQVWVGASDYARAHAVDANSMPSDEPKPVLHGQMKQEQIVSEQ